LVVQLARLRDGSRKVVKVSEVQGMESDTIVMQDLFVFDQTGFSYGKVRGTQKPTGLRPKFMPKMIANGIEIPDSAFSA